MEQQVLKGKQVHKVQQEHKGRQELTEQMVLMVLQVRLDQQALKGK